MEDMNKRLEDLMDFMKANYKEWADRGDSDKYDGTNTRKKMYEEFCDSLEYSIGKKYIKILRREGDYHSSTCGFVVNVENDKKFNYGDLLMAAGWAGPARNFARGNIFEDNGFERVRWTGIL